MDPDEKLVAEYQAAQETYLHYDAFRWQAGSILIAGVFVFWGFLLTADFKNWESSFGLSSLVVASLMSVWVLFAQHYRNIYRYKLHRIGQLESALGFYQHRRFVSKQGEKPEYRVFGPKGHNLDRGMYCVASLGTSFLGGISQHDFSIWLLSPLPVTILVLAWVLIDEHRTSSHLETLAA